MNTKEAYQKQQKIIEHYKNAQLELITRKKLQSEKEILDEIGITNIPQNRYLAYFRLFPQDFIVEEVALNNEIVRVNDFKEYKNNNEKEFDERTLFAHLIKIGIPTNVALERISNACEIDIKKIGISGLKDADAITAQMIAFPRARISPKEISEKNIENVILNNFYYSKGSLNPGDLKKNCFTITIRTAENLEENIIRARLDVISKYGVLNYFQNQRFGGLRLISHKLGKLIVRGEYELAIKYFLLKSNEYDIPLVQNLRKEGEKEFPNWTKLKTIFEKFPYTFFNELRVLNYLEKNPDNFIGALIEIKDQTQIWVYAYSSWLFNKYLSDYSRINGCVDEEFPIMTDDRSPGARIYKKYLEEDGIRNMSKNLYPFKFIQAKERYIKGRMPVMDIKYKLFDKGVILNFSLPKGSYATTFLMNLFELYQGLPIPEWVSDEEIDPKEMLGQGSIAELKERFKDNWYSKLD